MVIASKETRDAVNFMKAFYKDSCDEGGLAWDDTDNNRAFHAGQICATLNGASIYIVAKRQRTRFSTTRASRCIWTSTTPYSLKGRQASNSFTSACRME